jgi:hypothetical protein
VCCTANTGLPKRRISKIEREAKMREGGVEESGEWEGGKGGREE